MEIIVDKDRIFALLDTLLERWAAEPKGFPYQHKDAILPQDVIPEEIRADKEVLACFYFYICIYMRGGIKSLQAFNALTKMWEAHPEMFNPLQVQWLQPEDVQVVLKKYIGWDSQSASISWVENSRRLMQYWRGNPLNLLKGLKDYEEALRRIRNKFSKKDRREAGEDGVGFRGFQPKMVSMLLYFYDWEGWLPKRFVYPAPADFHNFRLAFAHRGLILKPQASSIRVTEKHSILWRAAVTEYITERGVRSKDVADAIWLFSLVMCGNSPATKYRRAEAPEPTLFTADELGVDLRGTINAPSSRPALLSTCLQCPIAETCELAIPAGPYYQTGEDDNGESLGGKLHFWPRPKLN